MIANNVHIAFREKEGSEVRINDRFVECVIKDAERIEITNKYIDRRLPQSRDRYFYTCRNWQFANMIRDKFPKQKSLFDE